MISVNKTFQGKRLLIKKTSLYLKINLYDKKRYKIVYLISEIVRKLQARGVYWKLLVYRKLPLDVHKDPVDYLVYNTSFWFDDFYHTL